MITYLPIESSEPNERLTCQYLQLVAKYPDFHFFAVGSLAARVIVVARERA